jgi:hypothetical protein
MERWLRTRMEWKGGKGWRDQEKRRIAVVEEMKKDRGTQHKKSRLG